jgi:hypothetical protein
LEGVLAVRRRREGELMGWYYLEWLIQGKREWFFVWFFWGERAILSGITSADEYQVQICGYETPAWSPSSRIFVALIYDFEDLKTCRKDYRLEESTHGTP